MSASRRRAGVAAVVVGCVLALTAGGLVPAWPGLVHLVGLPPLDLMADFRVIAARASSPPVAALGTAVAIVGRAVVLAAWLGGLRRHFWKALGFYLAVAVPAAGAAALAFAAGAALYGWFFWASVAATIVTCAVAGPLPWARWAEAARTADVRRRGARALLAMGYVATSAVLGAAAPGGIAAPVALTAAAALTVWTIGQLEEPTPRAVFVGGLVAVGGAAVLAASLWASPGEPGPPRRFVREGSLLLVPGVATASGRGALFRLDPRRLGFDCRQTFYYSYAGPGRGTRQGRARCPIRTGAPYTGADTGRPLDELAATFRVQVASLPPPVTVITHSQGAWIAWAALASDGSSMPVERLVMLGPFSRTLAPYPPPNRHGTGYAGGTALRALVAAVRGVGATSFDADAPLARELHATPEGAQRLLARPLAGRVGAVVVESRWDLPLGEASWPSRVERACPVATTHAGLATSARAAAAVVAVLDGRRVSCPPWAGWARLAGRVFRVPEVP